MTRVISVLFVAALFFGCGKTENAGEQSAQIDENVMTVSQLLDAPEDFVDQQVKLSGTVTHICKHAGKRLHLTDVEVDVNIRVEAGEAIGGFDRDLEGSDIVMTGFLREERIDEAYLIEWEEEVREEIKEKGEDDPDGHVEPQGFEAINNTREELEASGKEYLSRWSIDGESFEIIAAGDLEDDDMDDDEDEEDDDDDDDDEDGDEDEDEDEDETVENKG